MAMEFIDPDSGEHYDLDTVKGQQAALKYLGFDPGTVDGKLGPNTTAAIKKFQAAQKLAADGIAGPNTKARMLDAVQYMRDAKMSTKDMQDLQGAEDMMAAAEALMKKKS